MNCIDVLTIFRLNTQHFNHILNPSVDSSNIPIFDYVSDVNARKLPPIYIPDDIKHIIQNKISYENNIYHDKHATVKNRKTKLNRSRSSTTLRERTRKYYLTRSMSASGRQSPSFHSSDSDAPPILTNDYKLIDNKNEYILNLNFNKNKKNNKKLKHITQSVSLDPCKHNMNQLFPSYSDDGLMANSENVITEVINSYNENAVSDLDKNCDVLNHLIQQLSVDHSPSELYIHDVVNNENFHKFTAEKYQMKKNVPTSTLARLRNHIFISDDRVVDISYDSDSGWVSKGSHICLNLNKLKIKSKDDDNPTVDIEKSLSKDDDHQNVFKEKGELSTNKDAQNSNNSIAKNSSYFGYDSECSGAETEIHLSSFENRSIDKSDDDKSKFSSQNGKIDMNSDEELIKSTNTINNSDKDEIDLSSNVSSEKFGGTDTIKSIINEIRSEFIEKATMEKKNLLSYENSFNDDLCDDDYNNVIHSKFRNASDNSETFEKENECDKNVKSDRENLTCDNNKSNNKNRSTDLNVPQVFMKCNSPRNSIIPSSKSEESNNENDPNSENHISDNSNVQSIPDDSIDEYSDEVFASDTETKINSNRKQSISSSNISTRKCKINKMTRSSSAESLIVQKGKPRRIGSVSINEKPEYFEYSAYSKKSTAPKLSTTDFKNKEPRQSIIKKQTPSLSNDDPGTARNISNNPNTPNNSNMSVSENNANVSDALCPNSTSANRRLSSGLPQLKTIQSLAAAANSNRHNSPNKSKKSSIKRGNSMKKSSGKKTDKSGKTASNKKSSEYGPGGGNRSERDRINNGSRTDRRDGHRSQFTRSLSNADVPPDEKAGKENHFNITISIFTSRIHTKFVSDGSLSDTAVGLHELDSGISTRSRRSPTEVSPVNNKLEPGVLRASAHFGAMGKKSNSTSQLSATGKKLFCSIFYDHMNKYAVTKLYVFVL